MNNGYNKLENIPMNEQLIMVNSKIYVEDIDPYNLLDKKPLTLETLLEKYSILRVKNHPDKGGEKEHFITINNAIKNIKFILKTINSDKPFFNLKNEFNNSIKKKTNNKVISELYQNNDFNVKSFNKLFEELKFDDSFQDGYGDMITNEPPNDPEKINFKNFDEEFKKRKNKNSKSLVSYIGPEPLDETDYSLIGEKISYSSKNGTDYKDAFDESNLFNEYNVTIKNRTHEDIEKEHSTDITEITTMNDLEKEKYDKYISDQNEKEASRLNNVSNYDRDLEKYSNKINNIFLEYGHNKK